jgi:hypothetical protein
MIEALATLVIGGGVMLVVLWPAIQAGGKPEGLLDWQEKEDQRSRSHRYRDVFRK